MIKIKRSDKPSILEKRAQQWTKTLLATKSQKNRKKIETKYQHKKIKESLLQKPSKIMPNMPLLYDN